jgi:predicted ester cyclase
LEVNSARIREFFDRVLNGGDIEATGDYFQVDVVEEVPFPGQGPGLAGLKGVLGRFRVAFPDANWEVEEQVADADRVVKRFRWSGTHKGEFLGVPPRGRPVSVWGIVIDLFERDKVRSTRILMDTHALLAQMQSEEPWNG